MRRTERRSKERGRAPVAAVAGVVLMTVVLGAALAEEHRERERGEGGPSPGPATAAVREGCQDALLSLQEVAARVRKAGYGNIRKIEREGDRYEIETRSSKGDRIELHVDARAGTIREHDRRDGDQDD